jgi:hypothetical protein
MATATGNLTPRNSMITDNLYDANTGTGAGHIAFESASIQDQLETLDAQKNTIIDYIRLRLGDGMVDVEADKEHFEMGIKQALIRYRQKSSNSVEESYAFLDILPETQEYILPKEIMNVRACYRRGIGSVTGTTASQFEPFASGYLNTYMLVAGRVGGLVNYELFTQYQELAMKMFGGFINFTFNKVTKKMTINRKIPYAGHTVYRISGLIASGTAVGSEIQFTMQGSTPWNSVGVGDTVTISGCRVDGYNATYHVTDVDPTSQIFTVIAQNELGATTVTGYDLAATSVSSPNTDPIVEGVLLHIDNYKPDVMLLNDNTSFPWIQDYALALVMIAIGNAREKFGSIAGPQGGTTLNGTALKTEGQALLDKLDEDIKNYVDGGSPMWWVTG